MWSIISSSTLNTTASLRQRQVRALLQGKLRTLPSSTFHGKIFPSNGKMRMREKSAWKMALREFMREDIDRENYNQWNFHHIENPFIPLLSFWEKRLKSIPIYIMMYCTKWLTKHPIYSFLYLLSTSAHINKVSDKVVSIIILLLDYIKGLKKKKEVYHMCSTL